jgi:hypothetical protein
MKNEHQANHNKSAKNIYLITEKFKIKQEYSGLVVNQIGSNHD